MVSPKIFFAAFGKPGCGAPRTTISGRLETHRTQKFEGRFLNDDVSNGFDLGKGHGNSKFEGDNEPVNHKQKTDPKQEDMTNDGELINKETNTPIKNRDTQTAPHTERKKNKPLQSTISEPEVTEIHATQNDPSNEQKVKGSGSNPIHIKLPPIQRKEFRPGIKKINK